MALSEEAKRIARELGMREELPQVSDEPLTPEEKERILDELFTKYPPNFGIDEDLGGEDTMEDLDEETRELYIQLKEELEKKESLQQLKGQQ